MLGKKTPKLIAIAACLALGATTVVAPPAHAAKKPAFTQSNGGKSGYWPSKDFIPGKGKKVKIGGSGTKGSGTGTYFYVTLMQTSGNKVKFASYSWPGDGQTYSDNRTAVTAPGGVAYYLRWRSQDGGHRNGGTMSKSSVAAWY